MRVGIRGKLATLALIINGGFICQSFASIETQLQSEIFKYAADQSPTFYFSSSTQFQTRDFLGKLKGYYESGPQGAWSFDPSPLRYSIILNDLGDLFWVGREHPLHPVRNTMVDPYSALGAAWVQNKINALDPSVDGWVGAGFVKNIEQNWRISLCYSPLFIPSFGPSLGITSRGELNPSRFATLPPTQVTTNGTTLPIHYQIKLNQISELLLQPQAFGGLAYDSTFMHADVYAYTAPKPDPIPLANPVVALGAETANVDVQVEPQFPREYWAGIQTQFKEVLFEPSFEFTQNLRDMSLHYFSMTGYVPVGLGLRASFGMLTHLEHQFTSPDLSDWLVFVRIPMALTDELEFRILLENTLQSMQQSFYWFNQLEYRVNSTLSILAEIRVLSGQDSSYFGEWRNQDSYSAGVKWLW